MRKYIICVTLIIVIYRSVGYKINFEYTKSECKILFLAQKCIDNRCKYKKYGFIDSSGRVIIPFIYDNAGIFHNGLAIVTKGNQNAMINYKNEIIMPWVNITKLQYFYFDGYAFTVIKKHKYEMYNIYDRKWVTMKYTEMLPIGAWFIEGYYLVFKNSTYGVINSNGKILLPLKYKDINITNGVGEGLIAAADLKGKMGYINYKGTWVIEPKYDYASKFSEGLAYIVKKEKNKTYSYFIDRNGNKVIGPYLTEEYTSQGVRFESWFSEGLAPIYLNSKNKLYYSIINHEGKIIFRKKFKYISHFKEGLAVAMLEDKNQMMENSIKYGYINHLGEWAIKPRFEYAYPFYHGTAVVKKETRWGVIDKKGKWIVPPKYLYIDNKMNFEDTCSLRYKKQEIMKFLNEY